MKRYLILLGLLLLVVGCQLSGPKIESQPTDVPAQNVDGNTDVTIPTTDMRETASSDEEIRIMGKYGFDPAEVTVSEGTIVVWRNDNSQKKGESLAFKGENGITFLSTNIIRYGDTYSHQFSAGTYEYWSVGFGVKGTLIVE